MGSVLYAGTAGGNVARNALFTAGLPATISAQTIDRQCSSGLMAIAIAAKQIIVDGPEDPGYRPMGAQRGVRLPGPVLPRSSRHRPNTLQCRRRWNGRRRPV